MNFFLHFSTWCNKHRPLTKFSLQKQIRNNYGMWTDGLTLASTVRDKKKYFFQV